MRVALLGAGGFLGTHLAAHLAASARFADQAIDEVLLFDQRPVAAPAAARCPVRIQHGDLRDDTALDALFAAPVDAVLHLAATLTVDAETDVRRGLDTNVLAFVALLERCRAQASVPMLLFASSIATFGGPLPAVVGDGMPQRPTTSYGTHKAVAELLLADYSRRGFVDGRALRLPIVLTHPGPASGSISDQVAALVRGPLRGERTICRMAPDSPLATASVHKVVQGFLRLAALPAAALPLGGSMNLPGLSVTPAALLQAVARQLPAGQVPVVDWQPDPAVQRIVDGWPQAFTSEHALSLGFTPDASADALVQSFLAQERAAP
ncbi:NAD-dependent epimerase/dehydratase family protein [Pseudorhodoferax soli]|uniref:Nucleoside-diphosphate-sugar epimerase n=1 Tax=Pseudorhodoferax soli TaxID=545864 RepID=A0A368X6M7_9BURK|nr:NAD-dependent epimerase/dehydratase family protein [Pseudorhodoferax soli]RCW63640.1 nucleoside-diphosphate-sugar epimerase [Pseudorhodoferax soli]